MEQDIAILMADLSGYTALTETHGAVSAADLIDKYIGIAENCLIGNTKMHERTGDELMFVSDSPDSLLATALKLEASTITVENFLLVHGGLHFGKVLQRGDHYFGPAINLVSRIAASAVPGTFWCSDDFVNSVQDKTSRTFKTRGLHAFKNISTAKEVFEINTDSVRASFIDPVCRMQIVNPGNAIPHPQEDKLYFCSAECLSIYDQHKRTS